MQGLRCSYSRVRTYTAGAPAWPPSWPPSWPLSPRRSCRPWWCVMGTVSAFAFGAINHTGDRFTSQRLWLEYPEISWVRLVVRSPCPAWRAKCRGYVRVSVSIYTRRVLRCARRTGLRETEKIASDTPSPPAATAVFCPSLAIKGLRLRNINYRQHKCMR